MAEPKVAMATSMAKLKTIGVQGITTGSIGSTIATAAIDHHF